MGSHGQGTDTILSLLTRDKGGGISQVTVEIDKSGQLQMTMKKLNITVHGDLSFLVDGQGTLKVTGPLTIQSMAALQVAAQSIALTAGNMQLAMSGGVSSLDGSQVVLGGGQYPSLRASPDMLAWIGVVSATLIGTTPGNPVLTVGPALIPPTQHISPKVLT
jgi:hypothetical protein